MQVFNPTNNYTLNQIKYFRIKSQFTFTNCEENYITMCRIVS